MVVRGPCVFAGYFDMPEATREIIDERGWLHSGDLGRFDAAGNLHIVGRIKDMFKSGGYNVYPREVEIAIEAHAAVSMAVVVAVPDSTYQEVGYAYRPARAGTGSDRGGDPQPLPWKARQLQGPQAVLHPRGAAHAGRRKVDKAALRTEATATRRGPACNFLFVRRPAKGISCRRSPADSVYLWQRICRSRSAVSQRETWTGRDSDRRDGAAIYRLANAR